MRNLAQKPEVSLPGRMTAESVPGLGDQDRGDTAPDHLADERDGERVRKTKGRLVRAVERPRTSKDSVRGKQALTGAGAAEIHAHRLARQSFQLVEIVETGTRRRTQ